MEGKSNIEFFLMLQYSEYQSSSSSQEKCPIATSIYVNEFIVWVNSGNGCCLDSE